MLIAQGDSHADHEPPYCACETKSAQLSLPEVIAEMISYFSSLCARPSRMISWSSSRSRRMDLSPGEHWGSHWEDHWECQGNQKGNQSEVSRICPPRTFLAWQNRHHSDLLLTRAVFVIDGNALMAQRRVRSSDGEPQFDKGV